MCQILSQNFYNASDFELTILRRVRFWWKFFFKKHDFEEEIFFKSRFLKKFCIQKITFWFILPRKMRKFWVLRAYLQSTILKKVFLNSMILKKKVFLKSIILNKKFLVKSMILNRKIFVLSNFVSKFLQRVRFWLEYYTARQILCVLLLLFAKCHMFIKKVRFSDVSTYGVVSVSQVILLGWNLCTPTVINVTIHIKTANLVQLCSSI